MAELERVVKGTPEQLEVILTNGSITVDDITITREEIESGSTLFDTGRLDQMEFMQQVKGDMHRLYSYAHEPYIVKDLETTYNDIIAENPELVDKSAVGVTTMLKSDESIYTQGNILYINGVLCEGLASDGEAGYTFTGNGEEFIVAWYFEKDGQLNLLKDIDYSPILVSILQKAVQPSLNSSLVSFLAEFNSENFNIATIAPYAIKKYRIKGTSNAIHDVSSIFSSCEEVKFIFAGPVSRRIGDPYSTIHMCKKVIIDAETIAYSPGNDAGVFASARNYGQYYQWNGILVLKNLKNINGSMNYVYGAHFNNIATVIIPETVENIGSSTNRSMICCNNDSIQLNCKNANYIYSVWCVNTPRQYFGMCSDWGATINIAIAAANWVKDDFIDLIYNKLRDMTLTNETRELTIPNAMISQLSQDDLDTASNKGWTILGA